MDYIGKIISKTQGQPTQTSASGVWTLDEAAAAVKNNSWPIPGVPNPISKSLRFNSADSAYLGRTPGSTGSQTTWTWSGWIKFASVTSDVCLFGASNGSSNTTDMLLFVNSTGAMRVVTGTVNACLTTQVFRDPSAWYHIVLGFDTTQATASNRVKLYVNGTQITDFSSTSYPSQNSTWYVNSQNPHRIGGYPTSSSYYFSGYQTEINFIDGQQLTPSSFGQTNANTGVWEPKPYTGTYGTNGFYLNFKDSATTTALGYDYSGNGNNWTPNNFSVTAGAGNDSLVDVPTQWIGYNTSGDTGGIWRGNYATMNPLANNGGTLANGNLDHTGTTALTTNTLFPTSGKWYCELTCTAYGGGASLGYTAVGVIQSSQTINTIPNTLGSVPAGLWIYRNDAYKANNGASASYGNTWTANDVIGIAIDIDAGKVWFAKNGTWQASGDPAAGTNAAYTNLSGAIGVAINNQGSYSSSYSCNFGQRPFAYTPPAGFLSLCTTNLPTPTIGATSTTQADDYFNTVLYTGTGSSQNITGVGFQPDFVWIKERSGAADHALYDAVRGVQQQLESNTTTDETTESTGLTAFGTNGFTVGSLAQVNTSTDTYVAWNWKESTVSKFDIVTYTGNGTARTISHNLGVVPNMIIVKARTTASTDQGWPVYHSANTANPETDYLLLNSTAATADLDTVWNDTAPTSSVFSVGTNALVNANNDTYVAYVFANVAGYSAFGSYTGNGSADGPFIYTGFRPRFLLTKRTNTTGDWYIWDAARDPSNVVDLAIWPNYSSAEYNYGGDGTQPWDFLSNGIKARTSSLINNNNGDTYIYAAFAEFPFKYSLAR